MYGSSGARQARNITRSADSINAGTGDGGGTGERRKHSPRLKAMARERKRENAPGVQAERTIANLLTWFGAFIGAVLIYIPVSRGEAGRTPVEFAVPCALIFIAIFGVIGTVLVGGREPGTRWVVALLLCVGEIAGPLMFWA